MSYVRKIRRHNAIQSDLWFNRIIIGYDNYKPGGELFLDNKKLEDYLPVELLLSAPVAED